MKTIDRPRSADIVPHDDAARTSVTVVGLGAIGSNVAYVLSRMGIGYIHGYDDDEIAEENLEPQIYEELGIGVSKAETLRYHLLPETCYFGYKLRWGADLDLPTTTPIVISGVDSMESRATIAATLICGTSGWEHYIDGRMGGNIIEMYHVTPDTIRDYYRNAISRARPMDLPCSATSVAYNGRMCAAYIARMVAAILKGEPVPYYVKVDLLAWGHTVRLQQ